MKATFMAHIYQDDPNAPGTCRWCHVPDPRRTNKRHQLPDVSEAAQADRRRAGDREDDE